MFSMARGQTLITRRLVWLLLGIVQLVYLQHGAEGRMLATVFPNPLPPCNFPGAMPGWDCYDPPKEPLPPCDFKHQREGIDCSGWPPAVAHSSEDVHHAASADRVGASPDHGGMLATVKPRARPLRPCNLPGPGPLSSWDCFVPPVAASP